jgi:hypothetical protein
MKPIKLFILLLSHQTSAWVPSIKCDRGIGARTCELYHSAIAQDAGDASLSLNVQAKSTELTSPYLIHKGRATDMIKRCVSIEGLSLSRGWTPQATKAFQLAIEAVVRANPILTGKLIEVKKSPWLWDKKEIHVVPNVYSPNNHSFCTVLEAPEDMLVPGEVLEEEIDQGSTGAKKLIDYVSSIFAPFMLDKPDFTFEQIEKETPLFQGESWSEFLNLCAIT